MEKTKEILQLKEIKQVINISKKNFIDIISKCIVIIIDTREKKTEHIINTFIEYKIPYVSMKLDFGDYSFYLDSKKLSEELNINIQDNIYFNNVIGIERKQSFDELILNFTKNRERFENEFKRAFLKGSTLRVIVEQRYKTLLFSKLRSKVSRKAIVASIFVFENVYDTNFIFLEKESVACYMYNYFKYWLYSKI